MKWDSCSFILVQIHHLLISDYEVQNWIKTEEDVPHVLFYSGLIISVWVRRMKKLIILFTKVALSCHGKRNNLGAKERDSRREKWWEVMISRWPLYCIFLSHGAPRQLVPAPTSSFMSWGHCYFFCREVISLAVSLLLLPWSYSFCREVFFFFRESFSFYREVFFFAVSLFFLPLGSSFGRESSSCSARLFLLPWKYQLFARIPRSPTLETKMTVLPKQVDVPKFWGWLWSRICFLFSYLFHILWLWGEAGFSCNQVSYVHVRTCSYMNDLPPTPPPPFTRLFTSRLFQFPFFNKGKVNGGGGGGVWKVIHKLTLSINRLKKLSNKFNFPSSRNSLHNNWLVSAVLKLCTRIRGNVSEYQMNSCCVNSPWGTDLERKL